MRAPASKAVMERWHSIMQHPPHTHTPPSCLQEGGIIQEYPGAIPKGYLSLSEYPVAHDWGCYHPKLDRA